MRCPITGEPHGWQGSSTCFVCHEFAHINHYMPVPTGRKETHMTTRINVRVNDSRAIMGALAASAMDDDFAPAQEFLRAAHASLKRAFDDAYTLARRITDLGMLPNHTFVTWDIPTHIPVTDAMTKRDNGILTWDDVVLEAINVYTTCTCDHDDGQCLGMRWFSLNAYSQGNDEFIGVL